MTSVIGLFFVDTATVFLQRTPDRLDEASIVNNWCTMASFDWETATREMLVAELKRRYRAGTLDDVLFQPPVRVRKLIREIAGEWITTTDTSWN